MEADGPPSVIASSPSCDIFLLPGLNAECTRFNLGTLQVSELSLPDLTLLEKDQFIDDVGASFYTNENVPFFCVFTGALLPDAQRNERMRLRQQEVRRLARACWLHAPDILYDPSEHIRYQRDGDLVVRAPNICGRSVMGSHCARCLSISDIAAINRIFLRLAVFDDTRHTNQVRFAEILFSKCFKYTNLDTEHRYYLLLSSLMLLLADNKKVLKNFSEKAPFNNLDIKMIVNSRNAIAHGSQRVEPHVTAELEHLVRILLRHAIAWALGQPLLSSFTGAELLTRITTTRHDLQDEKIGLDPSHDPAAQTPPTEASSNRDQLDDEESQAEVAFESSVEVVLKKQIPEEDYAHALKNLKHSRFKLVEEREFTEIYLP
jgi:hypothetical protein